jgi:hypothetical protein
MMPVVDIIGHANESDDGGILFYIHAKLVKIKHIFVDKLGFYLQDFYNWRV